jgi:hypothetical protein
LSIENYENRTVAAISRNDNSVQQTVIDFGSHDAQPQNSSPILKYPGKFGYQGQYEKCNVIIC